MTEEPEQPTQNRLAGQRSAHLAAHSTDLINWRPWDSRAFKRAVKLDRPVFLSIGYQGCRACHSMQVESFNDPDVAGFLNRQFVCVKVDRDLRPDIDAFYQAYAGASEGIGGWPLNVFLLQDALPFLGWAYLPRITPESGGPSVMEAASSAMESWVLRRDETAAAGADALSLMRNIYSVDAGELAVSDADEAAERIRGMLDPSFGGLGEGPKYPQPTVIDFLLASYQSTKKSWQLEAASRWVQSILDGGLFDRDAGGIFRYTEDREWHRPSPEKTLGDQGAFLSTLAMLHRIDSDDSYRIAAQAIFEFLLRDLSHPGGGYCSSADNTITSHNAIASRGLIEAGAAFGDDAMVESGLATLEWILSACLKGSDLVRQPDDRSVAPLRFLEDYAATTAACLSAFEHTRQESLLDAARRLQSRAVKLFAENTGFVAVAGNHLLPMAPMETADTPYPAAPSLLAENAIRLGRLSASSSEELLVSQALAQFARTIRYAPHLAGHALRVLRMRGETRGH